ncbi:type VI secretion system baseplate subunit TssE [Mesorhizobium sp.]|jgi:type VI secretion system protein ImpF|uniref:type VI secretion system baseplate subunit TssE n=1 Tax=Mesorhizobium sp. TaxID=1871066 RepID=UPI000FE41B1D|nr:type VI secretion system baseplate subunit TssE [Mesorhizobium sp.]RWH68336.1 MAG: type VI secretion system baseplate subunit TssE [Mesorhizobium sp.]RWL25086.1 MAG: type VI secretion system baseplate subunit TssE [Mesorhizobium sp.]RWL27591.1 MAG: type VI secretion system baseplate subunit TssE [Mesorhizobium sp.]RWL36325.1 MAG: type VI secretion system baseplate subunit TssE [Mesorhizobium sp.]RWL53609.1 MAG: type VI secretion system baseplate subunit TssE [Mesorhizobium sp.]
MSASEARLPGRNKAQLAGSSRAKREAVQPSLWDRLVNDLPGLTSEIDGLRRLLEEELGAERVEALLAGSARSIDADADLTAEQKRRLHRLVFQTEHRAEIESRGVVVSARVLREAVRRDIEALFNTERFESVPMLSDFEHEQPLDELPPLADFPEVRRSVVNYGVPSFSGRSSRDFDRDTLAREIRAVLATFEPRLKESATTVNVTLGDKSVGLKIEIDAVLIMTPTPERMRLRTTINLDNGLARTEFRET